LIIISSTYANKVAPYATKALHWPVWRRGPLRTAPRPWGFQGGDSRPKKDRTLSLRNFVRPFGIIKSFRQYLALFWCGQLTMAIMGALFFYMGFYICRDFLHKKAEKAAALEIL
jgi:hypothetical protein